MIVLYILAGVFIVSPFLPATGNPHWFFRTADFVRLQSIAIEIVLIVLLLCFGNFNNWTNWLFLLGLTAAALYQINKVFKYSSLYPRPKPDFPSGGSITLFAANVLQTNTDYDTFLKEAKKFDADIIVTMESNKAWEKAMSPLEKSHPYTLKAPNEDFYGMHIYAKKPFKNASIKYQIEPHVPSMFLDIEVVKGNVIHFCFLHPAPPSPTENETSKERDAELMLTAQKIRNNNCPTVVCGDLNDVVWSRISRLFKKFTGMIDPRIGRGFYATYYAQYWFMRFPLDHLFHTKDLFVGRMKRSKNFGSDHFAMFYEIKLKANSKKQNNNVLDSNDKEIVEETLDNVW